MEIHLFDNEQEGLSVAAGQTLFREGDVGDHMYAVISGAVDIFVRGNLVETVEAGGIFGEMALIEDLPRTASATVRTATRLVAINRQRFLFLVQQHPFFALQLMTVMASRLRAMDARL